MNESISQKIARLGIEGQRGMAVALPKWLDEASRFRAASPR